MDTTGRMGGLKSWKESSGVKFKGSRFNALVDEDDQGSEVDTAKATKNHAPNFWAEALEAGGDKESKESEGNPTRKEAEEPEKIRVSVSHNNHMTDQKGVRGTLKGFTLKASNQKTRPKRYIGKPLNDVTNKQPNRPIKTKPIRPVVNLNVDQHMKKAFTFTWAGASSFCELSGSPSPNVMKSSGQPSRTVLGASLARVDHLTQL